MQLYQKCTRNNGLWNKVIHLLFRNGGGTELELHLWCSVAGNKLAAPLGLAQSDNQGHTMLSACCDLWQGLLQTTAFSALPGPLVRTMFLLYWFALILVMVNMLLYCYAALVTKGFDHCPVPTPQRSLIIESQVSRVNEPVRSIGFALVSSSSVWYTCYCMCT